MNTFAVFMMLFGAAMAQTANYCSVKTCTGNTLCTYKTTATGTACGGAAPLAISSADQTMIVNMHNTLRSKVALGQQSGQPIATNMRQMKWDSELANMAQAWANQCLFQHDTCRDVDRFRVGQNLAISMSSTAGSASSSWTTAINGTMNGKWVGWFSEVQAMQSGYVAGGWAGPNFSSVGHYTQMMWANSYLVGCAVIQYKSNGWFNTLNVCNYGPTGNFNAEPVYTIGTKAASACPAGTTANTATGLCV